MVGDFSLASTVHGSRVTIQYSINYAMHYVMLMVHGKPTEYILCVLSVTHTYAEHQNTMSGIAWVIVLVNCSLTFFVGNCFGFGSHYYRNIGPGWIS